MSDAVSRPLVRRDGDDPLRGSPPTSKTAWDRLITERHNRASQGLLAVKIIFFILVLVVFSYGERILDPDEPAADGCGGVKDLGCPTLVGPNPSQRFDDFHAIRGAAGGGGLQRR
jgi:hypothetical protein